MLKLPLSKIFKVRPSSAARNYMCPASAIYAMLDVWKTSIYAATGTGVMKKIEDALDDPLFEADDFDQYVGAMEEVDGQQVTYSNADMSAARECFDEVSQLGMRADKLLVERDLKTTVDIDGIKTPLKGRADFILLCKDRYIVVDYKNGFRPVSSVDNKQLLVYLKCAVDEFGPKEFYELRIIQPQSTQNVTRASLLTHENFESLWSDFEAGLRRIKDTAERFAYCHTLELGDYEIGEHCKWCPVERCCPARISAILSTAVLGKAGNDWRSNVENGVASAVLDYADTVKETVSEASKVTLESLQNGDAVYGYKLVKTVGKRSVKKELSDEELKILRAVKLVVDKPQTLGVGEFDKAAKKGLINASDYIVDGKPGVKVVSEATPGESVDSYVEMFD